jgi:hypothetical protein
MSAHIPAAGQEYTLQCSEDRVALEEDTMQQQHKEFCKASAPMDCLVRDCGREKVPCGLPLSMVRPLPFWWSCSAGTHHITTVVNPQE